MGVSGVPEAPSIRGVAAGAALRGVTELPLAVSVVAVAGVGGLTVDPPEVPAALRPLPARRLPLREGVVSRGAEGVVVFTGFIVDANVNTSLFVQRSTSQDEDWCFLGSSIPIGRSFLRCE